MHAHIVWQDTPRRRWRVNRARRECARRSRNDSLAAPLLSLSPLSLYREEMRGTLGAETATTSSSSSFRCARGFLHCRYIEREREIDFRFGLALAPPCVPSRVAREKIIRAQFGLNCTKRARGFGFIFNGATMVRCKDSAMIAVTGERSN